MRQLRIVLSGVVLGVALAMAAGRAVAALLPETAHFDAAVIAVAVALIAATAVVAAAIPAARVFRVNPLAILRDA
jgi:ABC-type antimicrobial peptide transport system permease subunit